MAVKAGSFTPNATGTLNISGLTFLPEEIVVSLGAPTGAIPDTTKNQYCRGWATASNSSYDSQFRDATGAEQVAGTGQLIRLRKRVGGVMQDAVAGTLTSFNTNIPGVDYGFTLNITAFDTSHQVRYIARG